MKPECLSDVEELNIIRHLEESYFIYDATQVNFELLVLEIKQAGFLSELQKMVHREHLPEICSWALELLFVLVRDNYPEDLLLLEIAIATVNRA